MLSAHLPQRYQALNKVSVIDHAGEVSDEIDILLVDRQYSPLMLAAKGRTFVPAECVYAVLESKQGLDRENLLYAANKVASVRRLKRTNGAIVHAGGVIETPKDPPHILGAVVTTRVDWATGLGLI